jgi:hypothetical protein
VSQSGWPGNGLHYKAALLQADQNYDLEKRVNNGHELDFWTSGMTLGPGPALNVATDITQYPNTDTYSNGAIASTGITISDFEETETGVWSFTVSGLEDNPDGGGGGGGSEDDDESDSASSFLFMAPTMLLAPLLFLLLAF